MPENPIRYRRLPGTGKSAVHYVRLYEGPDHVLQVTTSGYSESYKRFYYRDIQAIVLKKTNWWLFWGLIFGVPGIAALAIGLLVGGGGGIFLGVVSAFLLLPAAGSFVLGPTCEGTIQTAVQTERLVSVRRLRHARKIFHRIKPLIQAAQGTLEPEELARLANPPPVIADAPVIAPAPAPETAPPPGT